MYNNENLPWLFYNRYICIVDFASVSLFASNIKYTDKIHKKNRPYIAWCIMADSILFFWNNNSHVNSNYNIYHCKHHCF